MHRILCLLFAVLSLSVHSAAPVLGGMATIVDGQALLIRGPQVFELQEGMLIDANDILETSVHAQLQLEFGDGSTLGVGPRTGLYIAALPTGRSKPGDLYLRSGWLKPGGPATAGLFRTVSPNIAITPKAGVFVLHSQGLHSSAERGVGASSPSDTLADVFIESGEAALQPSGKSTAKATLLKSGEFAEIKIAGLTVSVRPSAAFLAELPRQFVDTLPSRVARFANQPVPSKVLRLTGFDEADRWMKAYPAGRRLMLKRLTPRLQDRDFRADVERQLSSYPEWDRILHPEKYLPKNTLP